MTTPWQRALHAVEAELSDPHAANRVERVEVTDAGAMILTLVGAGAATWFRFERDGLTELGFWNELALPCAATLLREDCEVLSWRPGRRVVVRRADDLVSKGYRKGRASRTAKAHRAVANSLARQGIRVAKLVRHDAAIDLLCFERLPGEPLPPCADVSSQGELALEIGRALHALHEARPDHELGTHTRADELELLARAARRWISVAGKLPRGFDRIVRRLEAGRGAPAHDELVLLHRDLHDGQFLWDGRRLALLDLDLACRGEPSLDVANLVVHFHLRALQARSSAPESISGAWEEMLLAGLRRSRETRFADGYRFHKATTALRLALLYGLRPRWSHLAEPLVDLAARSARS